MTRKQTLVHLQAALMQGDMVTALRIYVEKRISHAVFKDYKRRFWKQQYRRE